MPEITDDQGRGRHEFHASGGTCGLGRWVQAMTLTAVGLVALLLLNACGSDGGTDSDASSDAAAHMLTAADVGLSSSDCGTCQGG